MSHDPNAAFEAGFRFIMGSEFDGHLQDDAPGEAFHTRFGVTEMTYAAALKAGIVSKPFAQVTTPDDVRSIYHRQYYDALQCGEMPAPVAIVAFVDATLMGPRPVARRLQEIVGVPVDGIIGPQTLAFIAVDPAPATAKALAEADLASLQSLPTWGLYGRGWTNRTNKLLALALAKQED